MLRQIIEAVIAVIVPILFSLFKNSFPDFPLLESDIVELLLWAVGLIFSAVKGNNAYKIHKIENTGEMTIGKDAFKAQKVKK